MERIWAEEAFEALRTAAATITAHLDLRSLIAEILDIAIHTMGAERGVFFLGKGDAGGFIPVLARNVSGEDLENLEKVSRTILARGERGEIVLTADAMNDPRFKNNTSISTKQVRSVLCLPLQSAMGLVGVIYLDAPTMIGAFTEETARFADAFAGIAAVAVENSRRHGDVLQEKAELRRLTPPDPAVAMATLSPRMDSLVRRAKVAAQVDAPVLILGEVGTGKEMLARWIHEESLRSIQPFVVCNCTAIPRDLMEAYFFGSFDPSTAGPRRYVPGLLREAEQGTLFLGEIGELEPRMQASLLKILTEGTFKPAGTRKPVRLDARLISTSSRDLRTEAEHGRFREDLYHSISTLEIFIPPLRERPEDVALLARRYLDQYRGDRSDGMDVNFTREALEFLQNLPWPGNVRELSSAIRRVILLAQRDRVDVDELRKLLILPSEAKVGQLAGMGAWPPPEGMVDRVRSMAEREKEAIREALIRTGGNKSKAARLLGLHRNTLARRMTKLQIARESRRRKRS